MQPNQQPESDQNQAAQTVQPTTTVNPTEPAQQPQIVVGGQPSNPVINQVPNAAVMPTPQNIYPQTQTGMSRSEIEAVVTKESKRKKLLFIIPLSVILLAIIAGGAFYFIKYAPFSKFSTYSYPICQTHICSIKFYKGSKIAPYTLWTPPGQTPSQPNTDLISPVIDGKTYISMRIDAFNINGANTAAGKQLLSEFNNCSGSGETTGFSEYLPNMGVTANVCGIPASNNTSMLLGYATAFTSQKAGGFFVIIINENFSINTQTGQTITPVFNLADHQSEIESSLASLNVKAK